MEGMTPQEFERKLKKLNKSLWIDYEKISYPYHKDYPMCGLYCIQKFVTGVPNKFIPKWSIMGADLKRLEALQKHDIIEYLDTHGYPPDGYELEDKILWRGYKVILSKLVRDNYINREQAQKVFNCDIYPKQESFPRNYIHLEI